MTAGYEFFYECYIVALLFVSCGT